MELVYLEWEDASAVDNTSGWVDRQSAPVPLVHIFKQVGFIVDIDLDAVVLTEAYTADNIAPRTRIPMGMVRRWVMLDPDAKDPQ